MSTSMFQSIVRGNESTTNQTQSTTFTTFTTSTPSTPSTPATHIPPTPHAPYKQRQPLPPGKHILSPATFPLAKRTLVFPVEPDEPPQPHEPPEPYKTLADHALQNLFRT